MSDKEDSRADRGDEQAAEDAAEVTRRTVGGADAVGATTGAHVGAGAGAAAGPAGVLAGGAAGGLIGWLAGARVRDTEDLSEATDERFRRLHERTTDERNMPYEHVRDLYRLGHEMSEHPEFGRRDWREIEPELREAWTAMQRETWGEWQEAAPYVRRAFEERTD